MGTQSSNSNNQKNKNEGVGSLQLDGISSYKGIKSEVSSSNQNENTIKSMSSTSNNSEKKSGIENENNKNDERIPFKFEWKEGGNKVQITGTFLAHWTMFIDMVKNPQTNNFEFNINLSKINHEFKFIVDGVWKCSKFYPIIKDDAGNENNVINLTNFISQENKNKNDIIINEKKKEYNCRLPNKEEMNFDAPSIPFHYSLPYNIDFYSRQKKIGKNGFLNFYEKDLLSENISYKNIMICPHVNLNHICLSCDKIEDNCKYMRSGVTHRYKHKYLTIIYYKPRKT
jgi:5'-AMP-activated protein kinase regulatory beta subunit